MPTDTWTMPSYDEQDQHLRDIGAMPGEQVRFSTSSRLWTVKGWSVLKGTPAGTARSS
jgi:hypothetical protein